MTTRSVLPVAAAVLTLFAGCGAQKASDEIPSTTGGASPAFPADEEAAQLAETCRPAEANIVQAVEAILADGYSLGPAGVADHPEGLVLIADIYEGPDKVSTGDFWLVNPPEALPLSSSAEDYSTITRPDGASAVAGDMGALLSPPYSATCRPQ